MSTNLKIAKAYLILTLASILGHALSMGKEIIVANYFGITKIMDAFYTAMTIPNWITPIFSSPFILVFMPIFTKCKLMDKEYANRFASILINYTLIALFFIAIFIFVFSHSIIYYGFKGLDLETRILSEKVLNILSITIIFSVVVTILTVILNANEHFLWPAISQMFITVSTIIFILFFAKRLGIFVFAWGLLIGLIAQFIFLIPIAKQHGYKHYFDFGWNNPEIKKITKMVLTIVLLVILAGFNPYINRTMAAWLPTGSIAALGYADKLIQVPLIVFSGSIATAIYPFFSIQAAKNDIDGMKDTIATSIKMMGFIFIPLAMTMIILAKPVIQLMFQRGAFNATATDLTSKIFICYSFQLFSNYAVAIMQRLIFAFQDLLSIIKTTIASILLTILLNFVFIKIINPPAAGIALSSSIVCSIIAVFYFIILKRKMKNLHGLSILKSLSKTTLLAVISGIIIFLVFTKLNDFIIASSILYQIIKLIGSAAAGIIVFITLAFSLKNEEAQKIYTLVKIKISNFKFV